MSVINTHNFGRFWSVSCTITHRFGGPRAISTFDDPGVRLRVVRRQYSKFWAILTRLVDYYSPFWGPKAISMFVEPKVRLFVGHPHSRFLLILTRSVDYYSLFWGPGVISTIDEARGAFTCRSSTLAVLSILTRFVEYYSPFLGSQNDFHGCRTPNYAYVPVIITHSFGRFWPVSWTISNCFAVP